MKPCTLAVSLALLVIAPTPDAAGPIASASERLVDAVRRQDRAALDALLRQGIDVNARQGDGSTALHWAIQLDDLVASAALLEAGASVEAKNDLGTTPLLVASSNGSAGAVRLLLRAGADANATTAGRETPLMLAARTGNVEAVTSLLAAGADVNAQEAAEHQTALMWAAAEGHPEVVRALVEHGASLSARTGGTNASAGAGRRQQRAGSGYTPLLFAARAGDVESVKILAAAGAKINDVTTDGMSALKLATVRGHVPAALQLLELGADPNLAGKGYVPLHWAAGSWETQFTTSDIITDREGNEEWNALKGLNATDKLRLVKALVARGADPNARMTATPERAGATRSPTLPELAGATPFILAAMAGDTAVMRVLLDAGADPKPTTDRKSTALMAVAGLGRILGENTLKESRLLDAARLALELGADVKAVDEFGNTPLHYAAYHRLNTLVQLFASEGAELDTKNVFGETPLWVSELVIQWFGGGTFKVVPSSTGDVLRSLGAHAPRPPYEKRPGDWPNNDLK